MSASFTRRDFIRYSGLSASMGMMACHTTLGAAQVVTKPAYTPSRLIHGVAYYPELWPLDNLSADIAEMQSLGINLVRMAEFAWSVMEPTPGNYDFSLFNTVMDAMHDAGIQVVLCTPTATPPIWLIDGHPERCHKNADGVIMSHGARQHASYAHPEVSAACLRIVSEMTKALGQHPALLGWQLDNEMKAHVAEDFSDAAIVGWHAWLQQRFGTIDKLNDAWGTHMWSEHYQRFEQVPAPFATPFIHNASLSTAYRMYNREAIADFMLAQRKAIRQYSDLPITHNDNPAFNIHHERSMRALDFASYDAYPSAQQWSTLAFRSDLYRAAIPGRPYWLMETSVAHNGWLGNHQVMHPEGFLPAEAALIYALGGEGFCYWLWRQQRSGAELPHSAVKSAWNAPGIGYNEVKKVAAVKEKLEPLVTTSTFVSPQVALTYSDHARAMFETEGMDKRSGFPSRYRGVIEYWHKAILDTGYARDVRFENAALDGLKLLITPHMPYVSEAFLLRVQAFVEAGGIWIAGPLTGTRGKEHTVPTDAGLGLLEPFAGVKTRYVLPLTGTGTKASALGMEIELSGWCAAVKPYTNTSIIGTITSGRAKGLSFLTEKQQGKGRIVLLGAQPHGDNATAFMQTLIRHYAALAGVDAPVVSSDGVVVSRWQQGNKQTLIAVNMTATPGDVEVNGGVTIAPYGCEIIPL